MPQRFRYSSSDDIALLQLVRQEVPFSANGDSDRGWQKIANMLREQGLQVETRTAKDRFFLLYRKFLLDDISGLKRGSTDSDFRQKEALLLHIAEIVKQVDISLEVKYRRKSSNHSISLSTNHVTGVKDTGGDESADLDNGHDDDDDNINNNHDDDDDNDSSHSTDIAEDSYGLTNHEASSSSSSSIHFSSAENIGPSSSSRIVLDNSNINSNINTNINSNINDNKASSDRDLPSLSLSLFPNNLRRDNNNSNASKRIRTSKEPRVTQEALLLVLQSLERQKHDELLLRERELAHAEAKLQLERETLELNRLREGKEAAANAVRDEQIKLQISLLHQLLERSNNTNNTSQRL